MDRMRLRSLLLATLLLGLFAAPADAASRLTVRGAGFGHGVGMSQYGALGFAQHGAGYRDILAHYYTGTQIAKLSGPSEIRVLLQSTRTVRFTGAAKVIGERALDPAATYRAVSAGAGQVSLRSASTRRSRGISLRCGWRAPAARSSCSAAPGTACATAPTAASLEVRPGPSGLMAVNALDLESYVRGVVAGESPSTWPVEALKAQAVAARYVRACDAQAGPPVSITTRYPLAGLQRRRRRAPDDRRCGCRHRGGGRDLRGQAGRDVLLLHLRRAHGERRELVPGLDPAAVAAQREDPSTTSPAAPLGPLPRGRSAPSSASSGRW